jgi:hypothetical protein
MEPVRPPETTSVATGSTNGTWPFLFNGALALATSSPFLSASNGFFQRFNIGPNHCSRSENRPQSPQISAGAAALILSEVYENRCYILHHCWLRHPFTVLDHCFCAVKVAQSQAQQQKQTCRARMLTNSKREKAAYACKGARQVLARAANFYFSAKISL